MLRSAPALMIALAACTLGSLAQADVYRFTDDKGQVQYTDKPQVLPAERLRVQSQRTDVVAIQARAEGAPTKEQSKPNPAQQEEARQASELSAKDKAERCVKARERYDQYMNSQRLYKVMPDGERTYLTDAELDAARNSAKLSMEEFCK
jgi:DNA uptake protein ComE-like DNA-binding protein